MFSNFNKPILVITQKVQTLVSVVTDPKEFQCFEQRLRQRKKHVLKQEQ